MAPSFPYTHVVAKTDWNNFHGTVAHRAVPIYAIIDPISNATGTAVRSSQRQGTALRSILEYCFTATPPEPLRAVGATWSLSEIIEPGRVIVDAGAMNAIAKVNDNWFTPAYPGASTPPGAVPVVVQGGTNISYLNQKLGEIGLALQTSGASDGHRMAGCIGTGTHGSALQVGAVHDRILALYLLVAPDKAVLVQPSTGTPFTDELADWFKSQSGFPTQTLNDDNAFSAALVHLGSLGFVHSVVVETVPLYQLKARMVTRPPGDAAVLAAIDSMDTSAFHPDIAQKPFHFSLLVNPYGSPGFFVGLSWKVPVAGATFAGPMGLPSMIPSDTANFIASLIPFLGTTILAPIVDPIVENYITSTLVQQNPAQDFPPVFPGQAFGPTTLPPGVGTSTEIVVDQTRAVVALQTVLETLQSERSQGRRLMGAIGVRFVPQTRASLGMNIHAMNCYMELGSLRHPTVHQVHLACWDALDRAGIPYTCHWGQEHALDANHVLAYFGPRVAQWKTARSALLSSTAQTVFASRTLAKVGL